MPEARFKPAFVEEGRVTFVLPFDWSKGLAAGGAYVLVLFAMHADGFGSRHFSPVYAAIFAVASALWLFYVARLRVTTAFDGVDGFVYRRNLLWTQTTLPLAEVADVFPVEEKVCLSKRSYFAFTKKGDRYGKGWRLTNSFAADTPEFEYLLGVVVPAAKRLLAPWADLDSDAETGVPEHPAFYVRRGGKFVRTFRQRIAVFLLLGLAATGYGSAADSLPLQAAGAIAVLATALFVSSITLDTDAGEIVSAKAFGLWRKAAPFSLYSGIEVNRTTYGGMYVGTILEMRFTDLRPNVVLASAYFTRKLEPLAKETEAIVLGASRRREPARSEAYDESFGPVEKIADLNDRDALRLLDVWEGAVRTTHAFLEEKDIIEIKSFLADALGNVETLLVVRDRTGVIQGFMGVDGFKVEMLFVSPDARGRGVGGNLLTYAIETMQARRVDVNEQNGQALGFYERYGFAPVGRSETDDRGLPFPILHLELGRVPVSS